MAMPRTEEATEARARELDCAPVLVPVIERLDVIIGLLRRMPVTYSRYPAGATDALLRDLFPEHEIPT